MRAAGRDAGWNPVGMEVGELAADQERLRRTGANARAEPQRAGTRHRDGARSLIHIRQGERTAGQLYNECRVFRLLVELYADCSASCAAGVLPGAAATFPWAPLLARRP